jgi:class 3 adenylate cyclase
MKLFDPKVYDLVASFLADVKGATDMDKRLLAEEIQGVIEDYLGTMEEFAESERAVNEIPSPL